MISEPSDDALKEAKSYRSVCSLCHSIPFRDELIDDALASCSPYSFKTYGVSVRMDEYSLKMEEDIAVKYKITDYITLKKALRDHFRKRMSKQINGKFEEVRPEINIVFDFSGPFKVKIYERSYQVRLNYVKRSPDSRVNAMACPACNGRGCQECKHTGRANDGSFESFLIYDLPRLLNSTVPRLTWALKDMEGSTLSGNGYPVYLDFRSVYDRLRAPLMIPENPTPGITVVLSQSLGSTADMVRDFRITAKIELTLKVALTEDEIRMRAGNGELTVTGVEGKVWKKSVKIMKVKVMGDHAELFIEIDSGVNMYSWIGAKKAPDSKTVMPALFYEGEALLKRIEVLNVEDKPVKNQ
ncbi:MAG: hypothetical protein JRN26_03265 [Nitrososphaerota archaeon]|jgi:hypothetical protein|nr:hypothetical protein [Nitrososphaerota archaeon]MDG6932335.1 hypothetical protein [Nitrososphaerota archaeon]MDG6935894.1 hypothetical protein [Nitrososphaerota archaeon]MDG6943740.1 hypothetical protein [Nitrososphaerota archaeon]